MVHKGCDGSTNALVLYSKSNILKEFHDADKVVFIDGHKYTFVQKWNDNGVSGVLWDSAVVLAKYLKAHPKLVADRSVLELGAGLGLPSIVASEIGARYVDATDQPHAIPLLADNVKRNSRSDAPIKVFPLDWKTDQPRHPYQVVLGADLVYNAELFAPLAKTMKRSSDSSTVILFSSRIRYPKDETFYTNLLKQGFVVNRLLYDNTSDIQIFRINAIGNDDL